MAALLVWIMHILTSIKKITKSWILYFYKESILQRIGISFYNMRIFGLCKGTTYFCHLPSLGRKLLLRWQILCDYGSATNHLEVGIWVDCWVGWSVSKQILPQALCLNNQAHSCLIHLQDNCKVTVSVLEDDVWRKTFDGRGPLTEDNLWGKTTFGEDNLWQKTTFNRRRPLTEDHLWRKTTFDGRRPLTEDDLWRKTTFDGRRPLTEDDLWRKTTFDWRRPLMKDDFWPKMIFDGR